jgi:mannose-6-phosphate isomerase
MLYPLKFEPIYKDYIWGGRNLEHLGKKLPEGIVAESWEVSTHKEGISIIANGDFKGMAFNQFIEKYREEALGRKDLKEFPIIIKFIDANNKLSVQVHPNDEYAFNYEQGQKGKNELWYILQAKPGAKIIYGFREEMDKETFVKAIKDNRIDSCLKYIDVKEGDIIYIPAGVVHAIQQGILLAEIQENSDLTYRIYDYHRTDAQGNKRSLHIEKALQVIDFNFKGKKEKYKGLKLEYENFTLTYIALNKYFSLELYESRGEKKFINSENIFYIYTFLQGQGEIKYGEYYLKFKAGESIFIPASLTKYTLHGDFKALRCYVSEENMIEEKKRHLSEKGYSLDEIIL